jgi:hypothetical protein
MDTTFLTQRLTVTKERIERIEVAIAELESGLIQSYTMDTGQSRQVVTMVNLTEARKYLESLYNLCAMLDQRLNGSSTLIARPGW